MAADNYSACLAFTLKYEGGYVDHSSDPGGATNHGVTIATLSKWRSRAVTKAEVRALTREEAGQIYRRFYWEPCGAPRLPPGVDAVVFDWAVHSGPSRAVRALQKVLALSIDGAPGPALSRAVQKVDPVHTIHALCRERRMFLARLKGFAVFGRGWSRRVDALEKMALARARAATRVNAASQSVQ
jgi:lysozyme family protein